MCAVQRRLNRCCWIFAKAPTKPGRSFRIGTVRPWKERHRHRTARMRNRDRQPSRTEGAPAIGFLPVEPTRNMSLCLSSHVMCVQQTQREENMSTVDQARLRLMDRYWSAANYLTIGQIYLQENALLREPLRPEHIKPRLLGHWGTSPGLSFIYVHLNRLIQEHDVDMVYLAGPGHGGPALLANVYLEGTYTEVYPQITQDAEGMRRLFRQFSTPGGVPSHVSVPTPGSIHEGGELGYVLAHAFGAAFDNPDMIAV